MNSNLKYTYFYRKVKHRKLSQRSIMWMISCEKIELVVWSFPSINWIVTSPYFQCCSSRGTNWEWWLHNPKKIPILALSQNKKLFWVKWISISILLQMVGSVQFEMNFYFCTNNDSLTRFIYIPLIRKNCSFLFMSQNIFALITFSWHLPLRDFQNICKGIRIETSSKRFNSFL